MASRGSRALDSSGNSARAEQAHVTCGNASCRPRGRFECPGSSSHCQIDWPKHLTAYLTALLDCGTRLARIALPQRCELCVADCGDALLCKPCAADLPRLAAACPVCALPTSNGLVCGACLAHPPPWSRTIAAFVYAFPVDRLLQQLKYGGR